MIIFGVKKWVKKKVIFRFIFGRGGREKFLKVCRGR